MGAPPLSPCFHCSWMASVVVPVASSVGDVGGTMRKVYQLELGSRAPLERRRNTPACPPSLLLAPTYRGSFSLR